MYMTYISYISSNKNIKTLSPSALRRATQSFQAAASCPSTPRRAVAKADMVN